MRVLPLADPGVPDIRSPKRLLVWVGRRQIGTLAIGIAFGIAWMLAQALMPFAIGRAIQDGIVDDDGQALALWALVLLALGIVQGFAGVMRHRYAVQNWLMAAFRLVQVVSHHAARSSTCRSRRSARRSRS
jgi:ABC-type multidrug transport system fused ATPase/permease subunit